VQKKKDQANQCKVYLIKNQDVIKEKTIAALLVAL
jgi:hypothetical protein